MKEFTHYTAHSLDEAVELLGKHPGKARLTAGGTDILELLKNATLPVSPDAVIDIKRIGGLDRIIEDPNENPSGEGANGLTIGALAKIDSVAKSALVRANCGLLAEAAESVASPALRNMGTVGGNLAQEVRCWYYRYPAQLGGPINCLRKGGSGCNALLGDNRYHSIFGAVGPKSLACVAVNPSDLAVALTALDGKVLTTRRTVDAAAFFASNAMAPTVLEQDEIIQGIMVPKQPAGTRQRYCKFRLRATIDFAIVSVAAVVTTEKGICTGARIALGAVAPASFRAHSAEKSLLGKQINQQSAAEAAELAAEGTRPLRMNAYKVEITKALVKQALL